MSTATKRLGASARRACRRWNRDIRRWLAARPEVATVFQVQITSSTGVVVRRGQSEFDAEVDGYRRAWKALPRSVRHIIVIRDTPKMVTATPGCVMRAHAARIPPGAACARSRSAALTPDPLAVAAARARSRRIRVVNLTHYFCDARVCFPVIGGVLVYKDNTHVTRAYGTTLGRFLLRRVNALTAGWKPRRTGSRSPRAGHIELTLDQGGSQPAGGRGVDSGLTYRGWPPETLPCAGPPSSLCWP